MEKLIDFSYLPPEFRIENAEVFNPGEDGERGLLLYTDCEISIFELFVSVLKNNGYSAVSSFSSDNFKSAYFLRFDILTGVIFDCKKNEIRVVAEKNVLLPDNKVKIKFGQTPVRLWQYEIDHSLIDCGMCYIIQLSDFSFIIIDSPHFLSVNDDIRIVDFLKSKVPDGKDIIVRAWLFTHGHDDHIDKFIDIIRFYPDVAVEGVYYNFPSEKYLDPTVRDNSSANKVYSFYKALASRKDIPVYHIHSGQWFIIGDAKIIVLCTQEDVYPGRFENYNDSSVVYMIIIGDNKILFPGDAGAVESEILESRFPSFLKCDIVQVSHHGHFGCTTDFYRYCSADVALFPVTQIMFEGDYSRYEATRFVYDNSRHSFIASNGTVEFTFPLAGSDIRLHPDETFEDFNGIYNLWSYEYTEEYKNKLRKDYLNQRGKFTAY